MSAFAKWNFSGAKPKRMQNYCESTNVPTFNPNNINYSSSAEKSMYSITYK